MTSLITYFSKVSGNRPVHINCVFVLNISFRLISFFFLPRTCFLSKDVSSVPANSLVLWMLVAKYDNKTYRPCKKKDWLIINTFIITKTMIEKLIIDLVTQNKIIYILNYKTIAWAQKFWGHLVLSPLVTVSIVIMMLSFHIAASPIAM